jgi:hypothetical protein
MDALHARFVEYAALDAGGGAVCREGEVLEKSAGSHPTGNIIGGKLGITPCLAQGAHSWSTIDIRFVAAILFNKTPLQLRLLGARGGKAFGRNERARRALLPAPAPTAPPAAFPCQTTAEDIAVLDARFPWLRGGPRRREPLRQSTRRAWLRGESESFRSRGGIRTQRGQVSSSCGRVFRSGPLPQAG